MTKGEMRDIIDNAFDELLIRQPLTKKQMKDKIQKTFNDLKIDIK